MSLRHPKHSDGCCAALALLLLCRSHLAAAVPLPRGSCCMWRSRIAPVVALSIAPLLLWRSRITAAVPLSLGCCMRCMALSHRCCRASFASLRLRRSPLRPLLLLYMVLSHRCCLATLTWLAGAVARSYRCCRALSHRCCRAPLASRPPCETYIAATAPLSHDCCCGALASLLLPVWRSCIAAAVALSRRCRRAALAFLSARAPADTVSLIDVKPRTRRQAG